MRKVKVLGVGIKVGDVSVEAIILICAMLNQKTV